MSKVDQRALAIKSYTNNRFKATYSLPMNPELGDNEQDKIKDGTQDLFQKFGGDLFQIGLTNTLFDRTGRAGYPDEPTDSEKRVLVKQRLKSDRRRNKPRYYLICKKDIEESFYKEFKTLYPDCAVIDLSTESQQKFQEDKDYYLLLEALSPHLETLDQ